MFERHMWNEIEGYGIPVDLTLLSLSTCAFCKRARQYLENRGLAFRYLELDEIPPNEKSAIKEEFKSKFRRRPAFPSLVLREDKLLIGFIKQYWDEEIKIKENT